MKFHSFWLWLKEKRNLDIIPFYYCFQIIDDSEFESSEQFELVLSAPTYNTVVGPMDKATVIIRGPNDGK